MMRSRIARQLATCKCCEFTKKKKTARGSPAQHGNVSRKTACVKTEIVVTTVHKVATGYVPTAVSMFNRTASKTLKLLALIVTASTVVYFLLDRLQWLYPPMVVREFESVDVFRPPTLELHPLTDTGGVHVVKHDLQVSSARNPRSAREDHAPMPNTVHAGEPFAHAQIRTFESKGGSVSAVTGGQQCMPVSYASTVRVLGRRVEKCVPMWKPDILALDFSQDDIYITVKTTQKNHNTRMLPIVLTWLQTVQPEQVDYTE